MAKINIGELLQSELITLTDKLEGPLKQQALEAVQNISFYAQHAIMSGDVERNRENIQFELSTLASLASISASEVETAVRTAFANVLQRITVIIIQAAVTA